MFIANEDRALHKKLSGLVVFDVNAPDTGRPVGVTWLDNDTEVKDLTYPSIIITNTGLTYDPTRASGGLIQYTYSPEGFPSYSGDNPYYSQMPIPFDINYQVEVITRNNKHSTFLQAVLSGPDYLAYRNAYLEIPEDGTMRRLELNGGPTVDAVRDANDKRLFNTMYAVKVSTELLPKQIIQYQKVTTVDIDLSLLYPQLS